MIFLSIDLNTDTCTNNFNSIWENSLLLILSVCSLLTFKAFFFIFKTSSKQRIWMMNNLPSKIHHSTMTGFDSNERLLLIIPWPKLEWRDSGTSSQVTIFVIIMNGSLHCILMWYTSVNFWRACASFMTNEALYAIYRFCV